MAENATKCSAADGATQIFDFCHGTPLMVRAVDFNALYAECQKLRKDAERYRWLRDEDGAFEAFTAAYYNAKAPADIDAALDAAMATTGGAVGAA